MRSDVVSFLYLLRWSHIGSPYGKHLPCILIFLYPKPLRVPLCRLPCPKRATTKRDLLEGEVFQGLMQKDWALLVTLETTVGKPELE